MVDGGAVRVIGGSPPPHASSLGDAMKGQSLADLKETYRINGFCLVCSKGFQYPYGRHHVEGQMQSGTCSKKCEGEYRAPVLGQQDEPVEGGHAHLLPDSPRLGVRD